MMVAMACETRYCRGGTATGSVDHVGYATPGEVSPKPC